MDPEGAKLAERAVRAVELRQSAQRYHEADRRLREGNGREPGGGFASEDELAAAAADFMDAALSHHKLLMAGVSGHSATLAAEPES